MPVITMSLTTSGAPVMAYPERLSATATSHRTAPVLALSATKCASTVPTKTRSSKMATPRFTSLDGLKELAGGELEIVAEGWRTGPTATMLVFLLEYAKLWLP